MYMIHLDILIEDFKVRFEDLAKMQVPERILKPFHVEIWNADINLHLPQKIIDMTNEIWNKCLIQKD